MCGDRMVETGRMAQTRAMLEERGPRVTDDATATPVRSSLQFTLELNDGTSIASNFLNTDARD